MTARQKREPRAVTVADIEQQFDLASYWFGAKWCPAVHRKRNGGGYGIRVLRSQTVSRVGQTVSYDYFEVDADGTITTAPRGYAKEYKPGRVVDIEDGVARFETPPNAEGGEPV